MTAQPVGADTEAAGSQSLERLGTVRRPEPHGLGGCETRRGHLEIVPGESRYQTLFAPVATPDHSPWLDIGTLPVILALTGSSRTSPFGSEIHTDPNPVASANGLLPSGTTRVTDAFGGSRSGVGEGGWALDVPWHAVAVSPATTTDRQTRQFKRLLRLTTRQPKSGYVVSSTTRPGADRCVGYPSGGSCWVSQAALAPPLPAATVASEQRRVVRR